MCRVLNFLLALLSRFLFTIHGVVTVWRVVTVTGDPLYWLLLMGVALLGVEMVVTIKCTRNAEWKWFSPMVFLYLSTVVPSIWFLELSLLQAKQPISVPSGPELPLSVPSGPELPLSVPSGPELPLLAHITADLVQLDPENWAAGLEQTMLMVLVLGRWLSPKGEMSRDQLSQLLMVYIGLGADILDIFDTFKEPEVRTKRVIVIVGLALFSWALMQFPLVLTQTRPPKATSQPGSPQEESPRGGDVGGGVGSPGALSWFSSCCSSEVWSLLLTVGLQDGPFLFYRLYLMIREKVLNQLMIFFTCKNILIVLLEVYRIFVVQCEQPGRGMEGLERCVSMVPCCRSAEEDQEEEQGEEQGEMERRAKRGEQSCQTQADGETEREMENEIRGV